MINIAREHTCTNPAAVISKAAVIAPVPEL